MSSNTRLGKSKGAIILLLLVLFLSINIIALFIYFAAGSKEIQTKQSLKILDNENPLEYPLESVYPNKSENITLFNDIYETSFNNHKNTGKSSSPSGSSSYLLNIICGNGIPEQGEECDDGNNNDYDGCTNSCEYRSYRQPDCGNNRIDSKEECDLGKNNSKKCIPEYNKTCIYCSDTCKNKTLTRFCGDDVLDSEEECDDGNKINGDGCSANCTVEKECCNDDNCPDDKYSDNYCSSNDVYKNLTDYFCENGTCLFNTSKIFVQDCNNESYSDNYCYNNNVYINHTLGSCENTECILNTNPEKVEECGNNSQEGIKYCYSDDVWINKSQELKGCEQGECFHLSNFTTELFNDCGQDSCDDWTDYFCEGKNKTRTRTCYDKGCEQSACFNNSNIEKQSQECEYDCVDGTCIHPVCGNEIIEQGEECDDGNLFNNDGCDEFCNIEICEHDVGIRYSYGNSFGTGIAIKLNGTNDWLEDPVELAQNQDYIIKYIIDNKIQNTTNNIHVVVTINSGGIIGYKKVPGCEQRGRGGGRGGCAPSDIPIYGSTTILAEYNTSINKYHTGEVNLKISNLSIGTYNISVYVEKINETDCNMSDNYAEREIIINAECCEDKNCPNDTYSDNYCLNNNVWRNLTDYFCENGKCLFNITSELFINCGNETYSNEYCYDNDVYQNHSIPGCENNGCTLSTDSEKIQDCGADSCNDWTDYFCEGKNKTRTRTCYDKGCEQANCFNNPRNETETQECTHDCVNGNCIDISCYTDDECPADGWLGQEFCWCGKLFDYYRDYSCAEPGTTESYCDSSTQLLIKGECNKLLEIVTLSNCN